MDKYEGLKRYFGHDRFREGQEALIDAVLAGRDALGIMPTGGGKSICYQLPALLLGGVALVISPLISLMKDQVMALHTAGIPAGVINSSQTQEERSEVYRALRAGACRLLYITPERLDGDGFVALAQCLPLSLVAVDEAHCISQWGQDFRPSYLRITEFLGKLPHRPPVAAFTATATQQISDDIVASLCLRDPVRVTTGFDRPNLNFEVLRPKSKRKTVLSLIAERRGRCGIVYCATRSGVEKLCDALRDAGIAATRYHAGLSDDERRQNQEDFLYDRAAVMVATNAFGMGIDKSNVGFVLHYNMPKSLEAYYQEAGRAGRDGEPADCLLLYSAGDVQTAKFLIQNAGENADLSDNERQAVLQRDYDRLSRMIGYCTATGCLRGYLLDYFGQAHPDQCGNCGNCRAALTTVDRTAEAQKILSCIKRASDRLGYSVGASLIARTLCGSADRRVLELGLNELTTYGLMKGTPQNQLREYMEQLESLGYLRTNPTYGSLELTARAGDVLFRGERVELATRQTAEPASPSALPGAGSDALFEALRALRLHLAQAEGVPAYMIFPNATLTDMAARAPRTTAELLDVAGVGQVKAARYGEAFLAEITRFFQSDVS